MTIRKEIRTPNGGSIIVAFSPLACQFFGANREQYWRFFNALYNELPQTSQTTSQPTISDVNFTQFMQSIGMEDSE